ncbi:hypothetical protein HAX54_049514 [Datura stramonium]|uniref:Cytochrome P450 n=1 Tax=Datura stramonium TaxID=4076 RepID=A0ABS8RQT7_DATST|nr:hypothetical protein [Datura stramonium]
MEMKDWFDNLIMNTMVKMLFGVQYTADLLPYLRWLDIGGHEKAMKETAKEMESIVEDWLAEHRRKRELRGNKCGDEKDFMDVMLSICEDKDLPGYAVGVDTTSITLTWTLSFPTMARKSTKKPPTVQSSMDSWAAESGAGGYKRNDSLIIA